MHIGFLALIEDFRLLNKAFAKVYTAIDQISIEPIRKDE
jgi:hypothetical protein